MANSPACGTPERLYRRTGESALVGLGGVQASAETSAPLRVYRSIEALIRHGGELGAAGEPQQCGVHGSVVPLRPAAVLLDLKTAAAMLKDVREIIADDLEHAEAIEAALLASRPPLHTAHNGGA